MNCLIISSSECITNLFGGKFGDCLWFSATKSITQFHAQREASVSVKSIEFACRFWRKSVGFSSACLSSCLEPFEFWFNPVSEVNFDKELEFHLPWTNYQFPSVFYFASFVENEASWQIPRPQMSRKGFQVNF